MHCGGEEFSVMKRGKYLDCIQTELCSQAVGAVKIRGNLNIAFISSHLLSGPAAVILGDFFFKIYLS